MGRGARTKGYLKNKVTNEVMKFMFNPSKLKDSQDVNYSTVSSCGSSYPSVHYVGGELKKIPLELYIQGSANEVKRYLDFIEDLVPPVDSGGKFLTPPHVLFVFGKILHTCVVTGKDREFQEFDSNLNPTKVEIRLDLTVIS